MIHLPLLIDLLDKRMRLISPLLALQDMEIIICRMSPSMPFRAYRCTEKNEVFCDGGVDEVHGSHCAAGIVE
jgi:hypothetical protein